MRSLVIIAVVLDAADIVAAVVAVVVAVVVVVQRAAMLNVVGEARNPSNWPGFRKL